MPNRTANLTRAALTAAIVCVVTLAVRVPVPALTGAYIHPGDGFILLSGLLLPWPLAAAACGIGSALADMIAGYTLYAVPTLVIKAAMGALAAYLLQKKRLFLWLSLPEAVMVAGYFAFEALFFHTAAALSSLPYNLIQAVAGVLIALILRPVLQRALPEMRTLS